jgi:hypothetical protein
LAALVEDISKALVDLGLPHIQGIPQDPGKARDVQEVADVILERLQEAYTFDANPWD